MAFEKALKDAQAGDFIGFNGMGHATIQRYFINPSLHQIMN